MPLKTKKPIGFSQGAVLIFFLVYLFNDNEELLILVRFNFEL